MSRQSLGKKTRFEVFKRDSFTCQYCGEKSPDVVLVVDHIQPVAKDGDNDILNLITSCQDCNAGKGARELSDDAVVAKRKKQLDDLQERREQLEMMIEWQRGLTDLEGQAADEVAAYWSEQVSPYHLTESGMQELRKLLHRFGVAEVMECVRISVSQYLLLDKNGKIHPDSVQKAWDMVGRIAGSRRVQSEKPYMRDLYAIRATMRTRFYYCNDWQAIRDLENAHINSGVPIMALKRIALEAKNWSGWRDAMTSICEAYSEAEA